MTNRKIVAPGGYSVVIVTAEEAKSLRHLDIHDHIRKVRHAKAMTKPYLRLIDPLIRNIDEMLTAQSKVLEDELWTRKEAGEQLEKMTRRWIQGLGKKDPHLIPLLRRFADNCRRGVIDSKLAKEVADKAIKITEDKDVWKRNINLAMKMVRDPEARERIKELLVI